MEEITGNETTNETAAAPALVNIAPKGFEVSINVSPNDTDKVYVTAKMDKPSLGDDIEFTNASGTEHKDAGNQEEQIVFTDAVAAGKLFDKIVRSVQGYLFDGEPDERAEEWRPVDE